MLWPVVMLEHFRHNGRMRQGTRVLLGYLAAISDSLRARPAATASKVILDPGPQPSRGRQAVQSLRMRQDCKSTVSSPTPAAAAVVLTSARLGAVLPAQRSATDL